MKRRSIAFRSKLNAAKAKVRQKNIEHLEVVERQRKLENQIVREKDALKQRRLIQEIGFLGAQEHVIRTNLRNTHRPVLDKVKDARAAGIAIRKAVVVQKVLARSVRRLRGKKVPSSLKRDLKRVFKAKAEIRY